MFKILKRLSDRSQDTYFHCFGYKTLGKISHLRVTKLVWKLVLFAHQAKSQNICPVYTNFLIGLFWAVFELKLGKCPFPNEQGSFMKVSSVFKLPMVPYPHIKSKFIQDCFYFASTKHNSFALILLFWKLHTLRLTFLIIVSSRQVKFQNA